MTLVGDRIEIDPDVMLGNPVIRGTRIPVDLILRKLSQGATEEGLLDAYPHLTREDILAAVSYAADVASPIIIEMVRRIVEHHHPDQIILFGSHARGTARPDSDVDLLVVLTLQRSRRTKAVEIYRILAGIGLPKDIIVVTPEDVERYRDSPGTIIRSALREGRVLYDRSVPPA